MPVGSLWLHFGADSSSGFHSQLQTLDMDDYLQATADHILAQLFFKKQSEFKKIPQFKEDQAVNLP